MIKPHKRYIKARISYMIHTLVNPIYRFSGSSIPDFTGDDLALCFGQL